MKNPEMKVVRFAAEDVIATSTPSLYQYYTAFGKELKQEGSFDPANEYLMYHFYIYENHSDIPIIEGENGRYAWYEQSTGTWNTDNMYPYEYEGGLLPDGEGGTYTYGGY